MVEKVWADLGPTMAESPRNPNENCFTLVVPADDYDALAARLAEVEDRIERALVAIRVGMPEYDMGDVIDILTGDGAADSAPAVPNPDEIVDAQHDETGRMWRGPRSLIPRRYYEVSAPACLFCADLGCPACKGA